MADTIISKVAIDSKRDANTPKVVISKPPPPPVDTIMPKPQRKKNFASSLSKSISTFFMDFLETIVVAMSIFVVIYLFLVQPHEVKGSSMEPNFHNNDYILTDKISYKFSYPKRGDVIIFKSPKNPEVDYIKRVIALPGETVKVLQGYVYVNDNKLPEVYLADQTSLFPGSYLTEGSNITVGEDQLFVLGDNRPHSSDSREFGPIDKKLIIGKAFVRYWPPQGIGVISNPTY